jgi:hypothetical protein
MQVSKIRILGYRSRNSFNVGTSACVRIPSPRGPIWRVLTIFSSGLAAPWHCLDNYSHEPTLA